MCDAEPKPASLCDAAPQGSILFGFAPNAKLCLSYNWTIVLFKHAGWKEPVEFMHHCSTKWAVFLLSLKSLLETDKGAPWPNEIKLDSW